MDNIYRNTEEYDPVKGRKILILFEDMIADMLSNENLFIRIELFLRGTELLLEVDNLEFLLFLLHNLVLL